MEETAQAGRDDWIGDISASSRISLMLKLEVILRWMLDWNNDEQREDKRSRWCEDALLYRLLVAKRFTS